jgi:hypothetical protein
MEDNHFDDIIRSKVGNYTPAGFDPEALAALHYQMAAATVLPWYERYRTELLVGGSIVLFSILLFISQWYWHNKQISAANSNTDRQQQAIDQLTAELKYLKTLHSGRDTIRLVEYREANTVFTSVLLQRIADLQLALEKWQQQKEERKELFTSTNLMSSFTGEQYDSPAYPQGLSFRSRLVPHASKQKSMRAIAKEEPPKSGNEKQPLSVSKIREIEKHYQQGVGIRIGPTLEIANGFYSKGTGEINPSYGLLADFIVSPALSIETGIKRAARYYEVDDPKELSELPLPGVNESQGNLVKAEIDYKYLELPLNLKYRYPISRKAHWLYGLGYSSMLYTKQIYEYDYAVDGASGFSLGSISEITRSKIYPGTINLSIGLSRELKDKKIMEASLFYQYGLGTRGLEKTSANYLGVRGVYWFRIK